MMKYSFEKVKSYKSKETLLEIDILRAIKRKYTMTFKHKREFSETIKEIEQNRTIGDLR